MKILYLVGTVQIKKNLEICSVDESVVWFLSFKILKSRVRCVRQGVRVSSECGEMTLFVNVKWSNGPLKLKA